MSLETPTTLEVRDGILASLQTSLNQTIAALAKSFLRVLSNTLAGTFIILYRYVGWTFLQQYVQTAAIEETEILGVKVSPLIFWGRLIGVGDPVAATNAALTITVTVENQTGFLPAFSQLINSGNGVTYFTLAAVALDASTVTPTVRAVSDQAGGGGAGTIGNLEVLDEMSFANPLPNVARVAVVASVVVTAANAEATEIYRQRIIDRFQKRPQGGALADYEAWAEEVAGIINAYPYTGEDPGEVDVYSEATVESSGDPDGIPTSAQLLAVGESILLDSTGRQTRQPANAFVNSLAITRTGFEVEVSGLTVSDPGAVQADIETAVEEYFANGAPFIDGLTLPPRTDKLTQSAIIGLVEDIVTAANGTFTTAIFNETGLLPTDISSYTLDRGEKSKSTGTGFVP